jgi:hypothetical protein
MRTWLGLVVIGAAVAACTPPGYGHGGGGPDAAIDGNRDGASVAIDAPGVDAAAACEHQFRLMGYPEASSAWVSGDFVQWAPNPGAGAIVMTLGLDGAWTITHGFALGSYTYKFVVGGNDWILDPADPNTASDGMGNTNSVYDCM